MFAQCMILVPQLMQGELFLFWIYSMIKRVSKYHIAVMIGICPTSCSVGNTCNITSRWYRRLFDICKCRWQKARRFQSDQVSFSSPPYQPLSTPRACNCITQQAG